MNKIIKVYFEERQDVAYVDKGLDAWNYGEILQVEGLALPDGNIEVHFSFTDREGDANVYMGTVEDNVLTVGIPDFIFQKKDVYQPTYDAYAFIYQTDGESGRTVKKITFTIQVRPKPTTDVPEDQQDQFLQEARRIMAETKEVAQSVRTDADNGVFNGKDGIDGKDGKDGAKGNKGEDGKSAYQYAQEGGFEGTEEEFTELIAQAGQVDLSGYVTKEEHEAELLKTVIKTTTAPSPFHHITDSANMKVVEFGMSGKTEQPTTSGKNYYSGGDVSGTQYVEVNMATIPAGTYTISADTESSDTDTSGMMVRFYYVDKTFVNFVLRRGVRQSVKVTLANDVNKMRFYAAQSNTQAVDDTFSCKNIQIEVGEVATEYEPFTNGPSPNPDYKQEIKNAGVYNEETGRYEHKCCVGNKNLFDLAKAQDESNYVLNNSKACVYLPIYVGKGNTVTFSCDLSNVNGFTDNLIIFDNIDGNLLSYIYHSVGSQFNKEFGTITSPNDYIYVRINNSNPTGYLKWVDYITDFQIEIGSAKTVLLPHAYQPFTLTSPVPITKWDYLTKRDGVWGWSIWQLIDVFDGSETIRLFCKTEDLKTIYEVLLQGVSRTWSESDEPIYCNSFAYVPGNKIYTQSYTQDYVFSAMYNNKLYFASLSNEGVFESVDTFKEYLKTAGITLVCKATAEQAFIPLPDEEQELLRNLETYYGVTNVYNEQGCPMWLTYVNDSKLYVDKKLLEIQQAII